MKIFAIIVVYNGMQRNWIQKCFDSIINSTIHVDIIAIDNGSTDGSIDFIKENYPQVDFTVSEKNLGFGRANNIGLRKALDKGGDYFFLLNQDAWVDPNTIEELVKQAKINPEYGVISPMHLNGKGDALDYNFSLQITPDRCPNLYSDFLLNKVKNELYEIRFVCAAAWLVTKECLRIVGGFNPAFFHYGEDDNYVHRLHYKKLKIGVYPDTYIFHDRQNRTTPTLNNGIQEKIKNYIVNVSNPNSEINPIERLSHLKKSIFKNKLLFRKDPVVNEVYTYFKKNQTLISHCYELSTFEKEYIFL